MESEKLSEIDQKYENIDGEGWAEPCFGCLHIESDSPIKVEGMITLEMAIKEIEEELNSDYVKEDKISGDISNWIINLENKLAELKILKEKSNEESN